MTQHRYAAANPPALMPEVPLARAWDVREWITVCQFRAMLDALLLEISCERMDPQLVEGICGLGPKLPSYAIVNGCYLYLQTSRGGMIETVPDSASERQELAGLLSRSCGQEITPESLPVEDGLFECVGREWMNCWMFRNLDPSALVANSRLLADFPRWAICEAHERAHGIGLDDRPAVMIELAVAELLVQKQYVGADALLAESRRRLAER